MDIDKLKEYVNVFNENFFHQYQTLIEELSKLVSKIYPELTVDSCGEVVDEYLNKKDIDQGVSPEETKENVISFFGLFSEKYKNMVENLLSDYNLIKEDGKSSTESDATQTFLVGNDSDTTTLVHELTHRFVVGEDERELYYNRTNWQETEWEFSPYNDILSEINSILLEFLSSNYMDFKNGTDLFEENYMIRLLILMEASRKNWEKTGVLFNTIRNYPNVSEEEREYLNQEIVINEEYFFTNRILSFTHNFGSLMAFYFYEQALEDKDQFKAFLGLEAAQTTIMNSKDLFQYLESIGIPCFKDGKINLDEEAIQKILASIEKTLYNLKYKDDNRVQRLFENAPLLSDDLIETIKTP